MSITDELRKFANDWDWLDYKAYESEQKLWAIADRIDEEYQKVLDKNDSERFNALMDARDKGVNAVLKGPEGFGLIALPKDADDKYIHVGDMMEWECSGFLFEKVPFEVWAIQYDDGGWKVYDHLGNGYTPSLLRHHHVQTVEDVQAESEHMQLKALAIIGEFLEENVKLRELVRDLYEMAYPEYPSAFETTFADRIHKLGIKVE